MISILLTFMGDSSYTLGVLKYFAPWDIFWSGGIETFWVQKLDKKSC